MTNNKTLIEFLKSKYFYKNLLYAILLALIVDIIFFLIGITFELDDNLLHLLF